MIWRMSPGVPWVRVRRFGSEVLLVKTLMKSDSPPRSFLASPGKSPPFSFASMSRSAAIEVMASDSATTLSPGASSMWT